MQQKLFNITLIGSTGKLGSLITQLISNNKKCNPAISIHSKNAEQFINLSKNTDVIIDVSRPAVTEGFMKELIKNKLYLPYIIGCTGWTDAQMESFIEYSKKAPVILAPNFSMGVNIFYKILQTVGPMLKTLGYTATIHEVHHEKKVDSPSGTAKALASFIQDFDPKITSARTGTVVGFHEVKFSGPGDKITISHEATDRAIFAHGALNAAIWLLEAKPSPKTYTMEDVLKTS